MHNNDSGDVGSLFHPNGDRQGRLRHRVGEALTRFLQEQGVCGGHDAAGLPGRLSDFRVPSGTADPEQYAEGILADLLVHSVNVASPRCLGHMSAVVPGFLRSFGELILGLNQNLAKQEASRAATAAERQILAMLHRLVYGFDDRFYAPRVQNAESCLGICTSGGSLANVAALWCARNTSFAARDGGPGAGGPGAGRGGVARALADAGAEGAVVIGSTLLHYSFDKAVDLLGLGRAGLIKLPVDASGAVRIPAIEDALEDCRRARRRVIALAGIAGTTDSGSIDPLEEMAAIARRERIHFHVDAAWGGPLLFSDRLRHRLNGIASADSVTLDGHKQFCLPIGASVLLLRDPTAARAIAQQAAYMLREGSGDLGAYALEGSRPALTLLLHAALHVIGRHGYAELVEGHLERARRMARTIEASEDFELLTDPQTNIVLYRYAPAAWRAEMAAEPRDWSAADHERLNMLNAQLQREQFEAGRTFVSRTTLDWLARYPERRVVALRAVLGNPLTTDADLAAVLADQAAIGAQIAQSYANVEEVDA